MHICPRHGFSRGVLISYEYGNMIGTLGVDICVVGRSQKIRYVEIREQIQKY